MKKTSIVIAVIIAALIAVFVLFRGPVARIFAGPPVEPELREAQMQYQQAERELDLTQKRVQSLERSVTEQKEALDEAAARRDEAAENLANMGQSESEIEKLDPKLNEPLLRVEVLPSEAETISSGISLSGQAEASRRLEVRAETSGQVISEPIPSGTPVSKGDVLCKLDPGTRQANLDQARAAYETAKTQYASTLSLKNRGLASTAALQNANAQLEQAQSSVDAAAREIERLTIIAPFDGRLEEQTAELGSLMQPGSVCASLIALDRLVLVGYASETQVDKIRTGADALGTLRDGRQVKGAVSFVSATADPATRTFRTEVSVENGSNIRDGSSVRIAIALAGTKGHLIPQNALTLNDAGDLGVKIAEDGVARFMPVVLVRDTPEGTWVTGLPDAVEVIIAGQEYAVDGQKVEAVTAQGAV